jgi:hypothetical protein
VPGADGGGGHGDHSRPLLSRSTCTRWRWRPGNVIALGSGDSDKFLRNVAYTCEHLYPRPKLLILNYPHNPSTVTCNRRFYVEIVRLAKRYGFMVISDFAYADVAFDGYQPPSFLAAPGAIDVGVEFTTMSKGYNMAGWRVGFCCGNAEMLRGPGDHQGLLRLRDVSGDSDRGDRGVAAHRGGRGSSNRTNTRAARRPGGRLAAARLGDQRPPRPACSSGRRFRTAGARR